MTSHTTGTRAEWLEARMALLRAEKELTHRSDEIARQRRELPWVRVDERYELDTEDGPATLTDLFQGRSQLLVYHFMFGPEYTAGCPSCSSIADGFNGFTVHLAHHDVMLWAVSQAPIGQLRDFKRRMGWSFPWASSSRGDFSKDFHTSFEPGQRDAEYNFGPWPLPAAGSEVPRPLSDWAATTGTDWPTYFRQAPGMSAFALEDGVVYHTYSAYARGIDSLWGMYQWLDRAPRGRNEERGDDDPINWFQHRDAYDREPAAAGGACECH
jgi:predicted dithiol-disulfide oxidoreductase (DUF899 family)